MQFVETDLSGAWLIEVEPSHDERGSFARTFCENEFRAHSMETRFVQHSRSYSARRHTLRGMHFQRAPYAEAKLVSCLHGRIFDVIADPTRRAILARLTAIRRRAREDESFTEVGGLRIFMDGRDPEIAGEPLPLPRRERRILEFLASNRGRRVTKTQVFNAIYGIFDEEVEENVVESHISKLRKKLREKLGHDPIDSKRFLGYRLVG